MQDLRNPVIKQMLRRPYTQNPNVTRLTLEQPTISNYPVQQSDPYNDYLNVLASCSEKIQHQIIQDPRFLEKQELCESLIKQVLFPKVIPEVLQIPVGKIAFEELLACTQMLKGHYTQEVVNEEQKKVNQEQKIQEQGQQIEGLTQQVRQLEAYIVEMLSQRTEPAKRIPAPKNEVESNLDAQEGVTNAATS